MIERDIVGGAAHLWDCIPSKAMVATGNALAELSLAKTMGLEASGCLDVERAARPHLGYGREAALGRHEPARVAGRAPHPRHRSTHRARTPSRPTPTPAPRSSRPTRSCCRPARGRACPTGPCCDGDRILTTRQAYPPPEIPEHLVVIGSGVTGVEFTHMFSALGAQVTLIVSRQQVLPYKDPEVAAVLEDEFLRRGVKLLKGARAISIGRESDKVFIACDDGRAVDGSHALLCIGSVPNSEGLGCELGRASRSTSTGYIPGNRHCQTNLPHIYSAGDVSGRLPLSSVAAMQGRKIAEHVMGLTARAHRHLDYDKAAQAIFTDPEIAEVGVAEAEAFAAGRKLRVTKVPFSANPKALINGDTRGFVKILSDPATGVALGGAIVGRNAAELISVIAVAVTNHLKVVDIVDSLLVHPALSESLADAAS